MRQYIISIIITLAFFSCSPEKSYLTNDIKNVNPYLEGQILTFASSLGIENTLEIKTIEEGLFPDGMGAFLNERQCVTAFRVSNQVRGGIEKRILTKLASTDKFEEQIDFSLSLRDTYLQMNFVNFTDYQNLDKLKLTTAFHEYDDVVLIKNNPNRSISDNEIVEFYWSKSYGYVRLLQQNGVVWDLKTISQISNDNDLNSSLES